LEYRIFDIHTHVFPDNVAEKAVRNLGEYYGVPMVSTGTLAELERYMGAEPRIKRCLIHSTATRPSQVRSVNEYVASIVNDRYYGFGTVHPDYDDIEGEINRIVEMGLLGIKLHPDFQQFNVDSDEAFRIFELAEGRLPVLVHAGDENVDSSSPRRIRRVVDAFPKLELIAAHLGGYQNWDDAERYLVGEHLYLDTSSVLQVIDLGQAVRIIKNHGTHKCLFGTDFPMHNPKEVVRAFLSLGLDEDDNQKILWDNGVKLLNL
jgi:predicted TIM-barrel fold metal-dependent hydrolase